MNFASGSLNHGFALFTGKIETGGELTEKEIIRAERNSGVISNRVREIQVSFMMLKLQNFNPSNFKPFCITAVIPQTCKNFRCKTTLERRK